MTGVRTYRDDARGAEKGKGVLFAVEIDGVHTIHLGEIGHLLSEEKLGDIGQVDIVCVPLGGALSPTQAAALVAQLDPRDRRADAALRDDADCAEALAEVLPRDGREPWPSRSCRSPPVEPPERDDDGPPGVARQAGLSPPDLRRTWKDRRRLPNRRPRSEGGRMEPCGFCPIATVGAVIHGRAASD